MSAVAQVHLLLEVWREVGRHLDLEESFSRLGPLVSAVVPVRRLLLRRVDAVGARVETVAAWPADEVERRTQLQPDQVDALLAWLAVGSVRALSAGEGGPLRGALDPTGEGLPLVAGPLTGTSDHRGLLVLEGREDLSGILPLVRDLLEPFGTALANDQRLHELARLREAAEADRRALLTRLDRQDVSDAVVGSEGGLRSVMERVDQVARTDAPVLILGETGSGKVVVARAIHHRSLRASGPFLRVNCGAIPPELVDSELFGHERGSFTGAVATRLGWFERADGGTLFLDEIGELPAAAQVRLLRVLQDGSFERVGGQKALNADVRIVAATHRPMQELIRQGRFREDLWYRVSVFPIALPPLRDRPGDIAPLATHFARKAGVRLHGVPLHPSAHDLLLLQRYGWPGNVRELAAVIERAAILGDGRRLEVAAALGVLPTSAPVDAGTLESVNRATITDTLRRAKGRIEGAGGAAELLGINSATLRSRMRKMGIDWSAFRG